MPLLHFYPPLQAQNYLYDFFSPLNEILHKLTSCHFTLRNKNVERFMPKNTSPFHFSEQNCTIHKRTITQTHDLSCHHFFVTKSSISFTKFPFTVIFITLIAKHQKSFRTLLSNFHFLKYKKKMITNERRREAT